MRALPDRPDLRTRLGRYTGQEVIDIEIRLAKDAGNTQYAIGVVVGTINTVRAYGAIDEQAYMASMKKINAVRAGGVQ